MAGTKKNTTAKEVVKATEVKETVKAVEEKATKKPVEKKETAKKAPVKKTATAEKKTTTRAKKAKEVVAVEFAGKSYTTEALVQIAKDVWKYDLNQKATDFKTVEIYVKPEESVAYYVINGEVTGSFVI